MGTHIHNLAKTMIGQLGVTIEDTGNYDIGAYDASEITFRVGERIMDRLSKMNPETLGRIAAQGRGDRCKNTATAMSETIFSDRWLGGDIEHANGKKLLVWIACAAIVAEMTDILVARYKAERATARQKKDPAYKYGYPYRSH